MGCLFSSSDSSSSTKSAAPQTHTITDMDKTILSLKTQRNKLNDQQKLLDQRIDRHQEVARQLIKEGRKDRALLALKKKKLTEKQQAQLSTYLLNLEGMLNNIESTKQTNKLVEVLQQGNETLKQLQQQVALDDVRKLMDDTAEAKAYQDELNQILGQSLSGVEEEAIAEELQALEDQTRMDEIESMPTAPANPTQVHLKVNQSQVQEVAEGKMKEGPMLAS